jgi:type II secretory pathway pseudopilin PulG
MENASKALLIAGGVLIAILIVSVLVVTLNIVNSNQRTREKALATEQLAEFNQKYEAYNKKALRGTDIITLKNMAKSEGNAVTVKVTNGTEEIDVSIEKNKTAIFACTKVEYNNGRISALTFQKIKD